MGRTEGGGEITALIQLVAFSFFSRFLIPRNSVTNIFKPNLLQAFLGRRKRAVSAGRLEFRLEDLQWLGESL